MNQTHTITNDDSDIRLDRWFKRHYPGIQHSLLEKHLRKGLIRVDGKKAKTSDRVQAGQTILCPPMQIDEAVKEKRQASAKDLASVKDWVLYKDANIIVINKPSGLAVQGGTKITRNLDDMLEGLRFDAKERPKLIHRLDRDTSGALVLARTAKVAALLAKGFAGKQIEKTYWALVNGSPLPPVGFIDLPLNKISNPSPSRGEARRGAQWKDGAQHAPTLTLPLMGREIVAVDEEEGKYAKTEYRVLDSLARKFALMELKPLTGRMHQLRVHMAAIDCPIVGDHKYGGGMKQPQNSDAGAIGVEDVLHLHARRIVIPALPGGKAVDVTAPLPKHMVNSFEALGLDVPKR